MWLGLLPALFPLLVPSPVFANYDRRTWVFEQIANPPLPPILEEMKNQLAVQGTSYGDTVSSQVSLLGNARWVEVGAKYSTRLYGDYSSEGKSLHQKTEQQRNTYSFEVARSYVSRHGHYGRLGLEYVHFAPTQTYRLIRIGFNTGILETAENPFFIRINVGTFRKLMTDSDGDSNLVYAGGEIGRRYEAGKKDRWRVGGFLSWTYRTNNRIEDSTTVGRFEHMLFSLGPFAEYITGALHIRLAIPWRLWLDREIVGIPGPSKVDYFSTYPNIMRAPDVSLGMTLVL
jgi:hypothetical protein